MGGNKYSPLLHHLQRSTQDGLAQVRVGLPQRALEAVGPAAEPGGRGDQLALILLVGDDLGELNLDVLGALGLAAQAGERVGGLGEVALLDEEAGRVGEEHQTAAQDEGPGELDGDRDAVRASVGALLGGVHDARGEHDTDGDAELVAGDERTTDLAGALWE